MEARGQHHLGLQAARLLLVFFMLSGMAVDAFPQKIPSGKYQSHGHGFLTIESPDSRGAQAFSIESNGANGHVCSVDGEIQKNVAIVLVDASKPKTSCEITFKLTKDRAIEVDTPQGGEHCRAFCGSRAGFTDVYRVPTKGCDTSQ